MTLTGHGAGRPTSSSQRPDASKAPIFRDSVVENIAHEINLLHDFAACLPAEVVGIADTLRDATPSADTLRNDPDKRRETCDNAAALLAAIDGMLND